MRLSNPRVSLLALCLWSCTPAVTPGPTVRGAPLAAKAEVPPCKAEVACAVPGAATGSPTSWLHTRGNRIYTDDGLLWAGQGPGDSAGCLLEPSEATDLHQPSARAFIDALTERCHADVLPIRLGGPLAVGGHPRHLNDPNYQRAVAGMVEYLGTKSHTYVLLSLPLAKDRVADWGTLADMFKVSPHVLFGIPTEPARATNLAAGDRALGTVGDIVTAIRTAEDSAGAPHHIISLPAAIITAGKARALKGDNLAYDLDSPVSPGGRGPPAPTSTTRP